MKGYVSLILHAHLPYVRHPEHENFLEEHWLYEAMNETYIPLIDVFDRLNNEGVPFQITLTLTPSLLSMLSDELLMGRFEKYLYSRIELAEKEVKRTQNMYQVSEVSKMYLERFQRNLNIFVHQYNRNLIAAFRKFYDLGFLEILTCSATHGFLPLMEVVPEAVYAQIKIGIDTHRKLLGHSPHGIWLPECGYTPALDPILKELGILYYILENHGVQYADPAPAHSVYAPICSPNGVVAFGRDTESSKQVWSADEGYPGDFDYREFYRDIGFELDLDYLTPYILPGGQRMHTGLKYYRITGKTEDKHIYVPDNAQEKAAQHAGNFMFNRECQIQFLSNGMEQPPIVVCPYDAELFGHWWYEGPEWIYYLMKKTYYDQKVFAMTTPLSYLQEYPMVQVAQPAASSWGYQGYNEVWLNGSNDWIYPHLHEMAKRMRAMANQYPGAQGTERRALCQAARELLLAQSSDWAFIMKTGTMVPYAEYRTRIHIHRFHTLYEQIKNHCIDKEWLHDVELKDNIFPHLDYSVYQSSKLPLEMMDDLQRAAMLYRSAH